MLFEAMQSLTQQIASSHQARGTSIKSILESAAHQRQAARAQLQEFDKAHQAMAQQQRERFSQFRTSRTAADGHRRATTQGHMKDLFNDNAKAHDAWQRMSATLHGKKAPASNGAAPEQGGPERPNARPSAKQAHRSTAHHG